MKKLLAIVLCALMLLGSAVAEQPMQSWSVTVDGISVTHKGETVSLSPTLDVQTGMDAAGCWAQVSVLLDGSVLLTGQVEYVGDTLFISADGANDALLVESAELFLNQYGLSGAQAQGLIGALFNMMATGSDVLPDNRSIDIQMTGENAAVLTLAKDDITVSACLTWEPRENVLPYDLSNKNVCRYTFREMFPGDGTDIPEAANAALAALFADDSIRELMALLSGTAAM